VTPRLVRAALARADLQEIWSYVAEDDLRAADALIDRLDRAAQMLAERPFIGRLRPDIHADVRGFSVGRYLLIYRPIKGGVEIVRVVHGARDLARLF
jgi:toxin ParE1/3/4